LRQIYTRGHLRFFPCLACDPRFSESARSPHHIPTFRVSRNQSNDVCALLLAKESIYLYAVGHQWSVMKFQPATEEKVPPPNRYRRKLLPLDILPKIKIRSCSMSMNKPAEFVHPSSNLQFLRLIFRESWRNLVLLRRLRFLQRSASLNAISFRETSRSRAVVGHFGDGITADRRNHAPLSNRFFIGTVHSTVKKTSPIDKAARKPEEKQDH
jgi:hypothetical protein